MKRRASLLASRLLLIAPCACCLMLVACQLPALPTANAQHCHCHCQAAARTTDHGPRGTGTDTSGVPQCSSGSGSASGSGADGGPAVSSFVLVNCNYEPNGLVPMASINERTSFRFKTLNWIAHARVE